MSKGLGCELSQGSGKTTATVFVLRMSDAHAPRVGAVELSFVVAETEVNCTVARVSAVTKEEEGREGGRAIENVEKRIDFFVCLPGACAPLALR